MEGINFLSVDTLVGAGAGVGSLMFVWVAWAMFKRALGLMRMLRKSAFGAIMLIAGATSVAWGIGDLSCQPDKPRYQISGVSYEQQEEQQKPILPLQGAAGLIGLGLATAGVGVATGIRSFLCV